MQKRRGRIKAISRNRKHSIVPVSLRPQQEEMKRKSKPSIRPEKALAAKLGVELIAGVDEAGRGPIAGPVVAAAVIFDLNGRRPPGLNDSKKLSALQREKLARAVRRSALAWGIGVATPQEIDLINILEATRLAACRAVRAMAVQPLGLVTDYLVLPDLELPTEALVKGDAISVSIAAASILAKTHRDALMDAYHREFPEYGWDRNRGYPTEDHYAAVREYGPTSLHRMTFAGVDFFCQEPRRSPSYCRISERLACLPAEDGDTIAELEAAYHAARLGLPPEDDQLLLQQFESRKISRGSVR